jgi:hypothetical protein
MMSTTKSPTKGSKVPKTIRDELRMAIALKGYSSIREGSGKTLKQQMDLLYQFFHGQEPTHPSQLRLLCNGGYPYNEFYESSSKVATKKSSTANDTSSLVLKQSLSLDRFRTYYAGIDIKHKDLEKKHMTGLMLMSGRSLLALAKKGYKMFKKANSFAEQKWDIKKCQPKESGLTIEDIVDFVRTEMFKSLNSSMTEFEKAKELDNELEEEYCKVADENESIELENKKDNEDEDKRDDDNDDIILPEGYMFPGFMAFMVWGPFANESNRLPIFNVGDACKSTVIPRAEKRKSDALLKSKERSNDSGHNRGYTIDQRISYESLMLQKKSQDQVSNEAALVALIAHESAFSKSIENAERRAAMRCKEYDSDNIHWKKVDNMIEEHDRILDDLKKYSESLKAVATDKNTADNIDDFINGKETSNKDKDNSDNTDGHQIAGISAGTLDQPSDDILSELSHSNVSSSLCKM